MRRRVKLSLGCALALLLLGLAIYGAVWYQRFSPLATQYVQYHYNSATGQVRYSFTAARPGHWVALKALDKRVYGAIVVSEDWAFYLHSGLDLQQIRRALWDFFKGEKLRGASTITQQLIKNIYLRGDSNWVRKFKEALLAPIAERVLSKHKILEIYLNIIEYGEGIYGLSNASLYYFQKFPENLTAREGAFLAVLLPNPKKYSQSFLKGETSEFITEGVGEVLEKMQMAGYLSAEEFEQATDNPVGPDGDEQEFD